MCSRVQGFRVLFKVGRSHLDRTLVVHMQGPATGLGPCPHLGPSPGSLRSNTASPPSTPSYAAFVVSNRVRSNNRRCEQGRVKLELVYTPLAYEEDSSPHRNPEPAPPPLSAAPTAASATSPAKVSGSSDDAGGAGSEAPPAQGSQTLVLANKGGPKGASEGLDWSTLAGRILAHQALVPAKSLARKDDEIAAVGAGWGGEYELCCFVSHNATSTQAAMWRDVAAQRVRDARRLTERKREGERKRHARTVR